MPELASDDRVLLEALRRGEDSAYERLVREHGPRLLAVARRLLSDEADAQDALQDALLSAFRGLGRFAGDARLSTWLHRITVNACLMKLRGRSRRPESALEELLPRFLGDGHQAEPAAAWRTLDECELERAETRALVRRAIDELPAGYREVLVLRDLDGRDTADTAALLGLSENAAKIRLHRARQALRTLLDPHFRQVPP